MSENELKKRIQEIIEKHYQLGLWSLKPELDYEESIKPFVDELASLMRNKPSPIV